MSGFHDAFSNGLQQIGAEPEKSFDGQFILATINTRQGAARHN
jgi:hypothetical protein